MQCPSSAQTAQRVLAHALDTLLRLLHPMIPFLTEEVWQLLGAGGAASAGSSRSRKRRPRASDRPLADGGHRAAGRRRSKQQFADFQAVLGAVREIRQRQNIPFKEELSFAVRCDAATAKLLEPMQPYFTQMAKATGTALGPARRRRRTCRPASRSPASTARSKSTST